MGDSVINSFLSSLKFYSFLLVRSEKRTSCWLENLKGRDHIGRRTRRWNEMLKLELGGMCACFWRYYAVARCYEENSEALVASKRIFLDKLSSIGFSKGNTVSYNYFLQNLTWKCRLRSLECATLSLWSLFTKLSEEHRPSSSGCVCST
jgi:hypothetical protein